MIGNVVGVALGIVVALGTGIALGAGTVPVSGRGHVRVIGGAIGFGSHPKPDHDRIIFVSIATSLSSKAAPSSYRA